MAADPAGQLVEVAVGEVCPADALAEEHVAPEDDRRVGALNQEDDVAAGVPRDIADLEGEAGDRHDLAVVEQPVGRRADQPHAECGREIARRVGQLRGVAAADQDRQPRPAVAEGGVAGDVVGVAVGEEDRRRLPARRLQPLDDRSRLETGVDHQAAACIRAEHDVGVFAEGLRLDADHLERRGGRKEREGGHRGRRSVGRERRNRAWLADPRPTRSPSFRQETGGFAQPTGMVIGSDRR